MRALAIIKTVMFITANGKDGHWDGLGVYKHLTVDICAVGLKEDKYHGPIDFYTANNDYLGRTVYYEDKTIDECYEEELKRS